MIGANSPENRLRRRKLWNVVEYVAKRYCVRAADVVGRTRRQPIARARQELYVVLHDTLGIPMIEIGRLLDRDHSTVVHAVQLHHAKLRAACQEDRIAKSFGAMHAHAEGAP